MSLRIIPRAQWGARPWSGTVHGVRPHERTHFVVHYHGGPPRADRGDENAREVDRAHHANGWSGVGYNFLVGQDGVVREGRGWDLVGAHCPGHNRNGIGVYVAVGGDVAPTPEALASVRALHAMASERAGRSLIVMGHRDAKATLCPGEHLYGWVLGGMQAPHLSDPAPAPPGPAVLVVDGFLGPATVRALQAVLGVAVDGWHRQRSRWIPDLGPATTRALQSRLGVTVDGIVGPITIRALQRHLRVPADGLWGPQTTRALQSRLNTGTL